MPSTAWESVEAHIAYTKDPSYKDFGADITQFCEPNGFFHVPFSGAYEEILSKAPVVEFLTVKLAEGTEKEAFEKSLGGLKEIGEATLPKDAFHGFAHGWSVEDDRRFVLLAGWDSKETHDQWKGTLDGEQINKAFGVFREGVEQVEMVHVDVANGSRKH